jgi:hypothetical protein
MTKFEIKRRKDLMLDITAQRHLFNDQENGLFSSLMILMSDNNRLAEEAMPKPMDEERFWNIIEEAGWGTIDFDFKRIKQYFFHRMNKEEAITFEETYIGKHDALAKQVEKYLKLCRWEEIPHRLPFSGDDGFGDMIAHVIGLGPKFYVKVMKDVNELRGLDVQESFAYAIPYPSDFIEKDAQ